MTDGSETDSSLGRKTPVWVLLALALAALLLVAFSVQALTGFGGAGVSDLFSKWVNDAIVLLAAAVCFGRAILVRKSRFAWLSFSIGILLWTLGNIYWTVFLINNPSPPIPSVDDFLWLGIYPGAYLGLLLLLRAQVNGVSLRASLDGVIAALAVSALSAAVVIQATLAHPVSGSLAATVTTLAYPIGDLILLAITIGALAFSNWRFERTWIFLAAGLIVFTATDGVFLYQLAIGKDLLGPILNAGWLLGALLLAIASWQPLPRVVRAGEETGKKLIVPALFGLIGLLLLIWDHFYRLNTLALILAAASVLAVIWRMALSFLDNGRSLDATRSESALLAEKNEALLELSAVQEQLRQAQKMEAVGQLAGGVAHDFNNLLQAISGYAELATLQVDDDELYETIDEIRHAADRAAELVRSLLDYSRRQSFQLKIIHWRDVVASVTKMLSRIIGENIEVVSVLPDELLPIEADAARLEQALINMAVNARDAMPQGGLLRIELKKGEQDFGQGVNDCAVLSVSDDGSGMSPETLEQIFDPFFTTKEVGKGSGLGLSSVYGTIEQLGGIVEVESELGVGTTFTICLPLAAEEPEVDLEIKQLSAAEVALEPAPPQAVVS